MTKPQKLSNIQKLNQPKNILGLLVLSVLALSIYVHYAKYTGWESRLFRYFYDLPIGWKNIMLMITTAGSAWMVVFVVVALSVTRKIRLAGFVGIIAFATFGAAELLKLLVARPRPFIEMSNVLPRENFVTGMGFPSGHTAIATAVGLTLITLLPKNLRWLVFVWIGLVGMSRMYLGVHAPLDIIGGVLLGATVVCAAKIIRNCFSVCSKKT